MKTSICKLTLIFIVLSISFIVNGQDYRTAIGVRLGTFEDGITLKHFVNSQGALEGILSFGYRSFLITGLYEKHQPFPNAPGLSWFFGGGAHVGFYKDGYYYYYYHYHHGTYVVGNGVVYDQFGNVVYYYGPGYSSTDVGLDFILGMEYKFQKAPITLGLDVKPFVDFVTGGPYFFWDGALTARFTF